MRIDLGTVLDAYVTCALWSSTDDECEPLDDWATIEDIAPETIREMRSDVAQFVWFNRSDVETWIHEFGTEQVGHDFWLTRNHHGAGFWDRDTSGGPVTQAGKRLTDASHPWGEYDLYVGDDGKVYGT